MKKSIWIVLFCMLFPVLLYASGWQTIGDGQSANVYTGFSEMTSDNVTEGTTNKYFTDTRARGTLSASGNMNYDNATGSFSFSPAPVFTGLTLGSLNGVLKASGGVVSGSAAKADIGLGNVTNNAQVTSVSASSPLTVSGSTATPVVGINSSPAFTDVTASGASLVTTSNNLATLGFLRAVDNSKALYSLQDGIVDRFQDQTGVATGSSSNYYYATQVTTPATKYYTVAETGNDGQTALLLHCDGNFTDSSESAHTVSGSGGATTSTGQFVFGTHSCFIPNGGDYFYSAASADWTFDGDFTIDVWIYPTAANSTILRATSTDAVGTTANGDWVLRIGGDSGVYFAQMPGSISGYGGTVSLNQWSHVAVVRHSGSVVVYVNGQGGTPVNTFSAQIPAANRTLKSGLALSGYSGSYTGFIEEVRISKGIARWTANFTPPPKAPYGTSSNMTLISAATTAVSTPATARIVLFESDYDSTTINTDLIASVSRDGGTTYSNVTLANEGTYDVGKNILAGPVDLTGQPSGTAMRWKVTSPNGKKFTLYGVSMSWN